MTLLWTLGLLGCAALPKSFLGAETEGFGTSTVQVPAPAEPDAWPRHIVLFIGDGMGLTQITATRIARGGPLHLERFPVVGLQQTWAANDTITDSAASATAMATGHKTDNGMIGQLPDGTPVENLVETAEAQDWATGLVATSRITHATPAAFIAHHPRRGDEEAIARDFLDVELDLLIGGGADRFEKRGDGEDLLARWADEGVEVVRSLDAVEGDGRLVVFTDDGAMKPVFRGRTDVLSRATRLAMARLGEDPEGSFLLVEGSQIDWGGHVNHTPYVITEALDFDAAIGRALDLAMARNDTLIVVTADHETGGLGIKDADLDQGAIKGRYVSTYHTPVMVPVFAYGPGAELFGGTYDNTGIHTRLATLMQGPPPAP